MYTVWYMNFLLLLSVQNFDGAFVRSDVAEDQVNTFNISNRTGRRLGDKIQSGVAFLTGVKLGSYLSNRNSFLGTGSLSTAHNFQLFGKSVSSAFSLSYGDGIAQLPLHDTPENSSRIVTLPTEEVVHVSIIENPSLNQLKKIARISEDKVSNDTQHNQTKNIIVKISQVNASAHENGSFSNFLAGHNQRVKEFNRKMFNDKTRINSKY